MTTENVAVLFTDMVGSTTRASALSPRAADDVRRAHFSILRRAVAESGGHEVKNLGDGLMVVFASTSSALSCAVAMQQGVERDNRTRGDAVGLRAGLGVGEVTREDGDYFGDAVIEASRLCELCAPGQILATDLVPLMAGRRNQHICAPVGPLALKGFPDPVDAVEVRWEPVLGAEAEAVPLPLRLGVPPATGVVGRDAGLTELASAYARVESTAGREIVLVSGEAGLGKSTLVAAAARAAFDTGACVLFGHCEEDLATPYQLFGEALGHFVDHAAEDMLGAHVEAHGSELARLVPALANRLPGLPPAQVTDADTGRYVLFAAVAGLLASLSRDRPVVLVFDDLQWADTGSLQLLRHLAAADRTMRVLVLGTYRDNELSRAHPFFETLAALDREPRVTRLALTGLRDADVIAMMEATTGHSLGRSELGLARALQRETDGNPFFVSEVLMNLAESGAIAADALDQIALPDSVREVIGVRVGRLGESSERVLGVAAVIGRDFDLDVLARAVQLPEDDVLDALDAAAAVALVREMSVAGRYSFAHALIQRTLYDDLGPTRRARAHRRVAEALEAGVGARAGELARHWCNATAPIDLAKVMRYSREAGDAALAALAPGDALGYYRLALEAYERLRETDPSVEIDLGIGLGIAQRQTGNPEFHRTLLAAARRAAEVGDTDRLVAAVLAADRGFTTSVGVIDSEKVELLEIALARLPAENRSRALALATLCGELTYGSTIERRQTLAVEAEAIARSLGDDALLLRVLNLVALPLLVPHLLEQSLARAATAGPLAQRTGDPMQLYVAYVWLGLTAARARDFDEMHRYFDLSASLAERLGQPMLMWWRAYVLAMRAQIAGDVPAAERFANEAFELGTNSGQPDAAVFYGVQLLSVHMQRGTIAEMLPFIEQIADGAPEIREGVDAALALAFAQAGRLDDARRLLGSFTAAGCDLPLDPIWLTSMVAYAQAAALCHDTTCATVVYERLAPFAGQFSTSGIAADGPVSMHLGALATVLGRYDEAGVHFADAAAFSASVGAKFFAAETNLEWAQMLAERGGPGDIDEARRLLTAASTNAAEHGYGGIEQRAGEELRELG